MTRRGKERSGELRPEDVELVLVKYPRDRFATDEDLDARWDAVESTIDESLGRLDLGRCEDVDLSDALTFRVATTDGDAAVEVITKALRDAGVLDGAIVASENDLPDEEI